MRVKAYWLIAKNTYKESLVYRKNAITGMIFAYGTIMIQMCAWFALYSGIDGELMFGRSLSDMLTYTVIVYLVTTFTDSGRLADYLEEKMKSGEIALDTMRPVSPRLMLVARTWGDKFLKFILCAVPVYLSIQVVDQFRIPSSVWQFLLFIVTLFLGYMINLLFAIVTACLAFWFVSVRTLSWFLAFFTYAMSGAVVPLWMLPNWLRNISLLLPFQASTYIPMSVYMGTYEMSGVISSVAVQLAWIAGLGILQQVMWNRGLKRLVVHGG